jgi:putative acetyltransferase
MNARANPTQALRPFLPQDAPFLAEIFRVSIEELTSEDYSKGQQDAWITAVDDLETLSRRLAGQLTLVATLDGSAVGFMSLAGAEQIDMLYVHPAVARQGIGTMLCDALEKLAAARRTPRLTVDASDSARDFFEHRGYIAMQRNTVMVGGEWLANTTMEKKLTPQGSAS